MLTHACVSMCSDLLFLFIERVIMSPSAYPQNGKYRHNIERREPWKLPNQDIEIPPPPKIPNKPSDVSLLTMILPPAIMIVGSILSQVFLGGRSLVAIIPMMMMGLGYPAANLITNKVAKKKYAEAVENRQQVYVRMLQESRNHIEGTMRQQRAVLSEEFPDMQKTIAIGMAAGKNKRLWWRRSNELDFLNLRVGQGNSELSFRILPPKSMNQDDPLRELPFELIDHFEKIDQVPFLVDLKKLGSLTIFGESFRNILRVSRRLLVDIIVHHSPEDVNLFVLADRLNADEEYEWLKWVPHTHALDESYEGRNLLFTSDQINNFLDELIKVHLERLETVGRLSSSNNQIPGPAIVVVLDDNGVIRQHEDLKRIAHEGYQTGIYPVFITNYSVPASCRAHIEIDTAGTIQYLETYDAQGSGNHRKGQAELCSKRDVEPLARVLAGIEVAGGKSSYSLPSLVRVVDILEGDPFSVDDVVSRWSKPTADSEQVLFPIGKFVDRAGLTTYEIDFRPESKGGKGAYHAMMIGTTGSGKSIFMQSMVLAAAHRYSPKQMNFMFMDFKAGAAELKKVADLPHSVGMVTDLSRELADRSLQALENELARRKIVFDNAGKITDIWDYNQRFPSEAMPQLLVVIDEFAEGINILPNLVDRLKELGRQGRAFGIYFFLANQEVNPAVEQLKANVSWYVLLKVNRQEEMSLIGRNLPVPPGRGRGYVKVKNDITTVQSAYAGLPANLENTESAEIEEYVIYTFGPNGERQELFRNDPRKQLGSNETAKAELDALVNTIKKAANQLNIQQAEPIYLEPLPPVISLDEIFYQSQVYCMYRGKEWEQSIGERNIVPLGYLDIPQRCQQVPFSLDFNEESGHLWVIGTPSSGKDVVLSSLLTSLCLSHTPSDVQVYVLDFDVGTLSCLESFPHVGAVIRSHESERVERLFRFLDAQMQLRTETDWRSNRLPDLYFVINNVAELRQTYPEQADSLSRYLRSGGGLGIHVVITSNRGGELPRSLSGNITRRIVLQLTEKQDYMDVLNAIVPLLTMRAEGRGYLLSNGEIAECQVAIPLASILQTAVPFNERTVPLVKQNQKARDQYLNDVGVVVSNLGEKMSSAWSGELPKQIFAMEDTLPIDEYHKILKRSSLGFQFLPMPLGLYYESLEPVIPDAKGEIPFWTVIGGRQSGKSTFLLNIIYQLLGQNRGDCEIRVLSFRKGPLSCLADTHDRLYITSIQSEMVQVMEEFPQVLTSQTEVFHVLMLDDLGLAFTTNQAAVTSALDKLIETLSLGNFDNYLIIIADMYSNLKNSQTFSSKFIKAFQQSQTGVFLSLDDNDMQWFAARVSLKDKKKLRLLPGRGFLVHKGNTDFIQIPMLEPNYVMEFLKSRQEGDAHG